jgi:hypothetical protein
VVNAIIKPATLRAGEHGASCSFAQRLRATGARDAHGRASVAPATRFVSHAWRYVFADLLEALSEHAERERAADADEAPAHYWLDFLACNQHMTLDVPHEWWSSTFRNSVAAIRHTVLVLAPWDAPLPLTRSWCLWETFCSIDCGATLEVALGSRESAAFQDALVRHASLLSFAFALHSHSTGLLRACRRTASRTLRAR